MLQLTTILLLSATLACQQAKSTSPTRIEIGLVRLGAVAEATVHIHWQAPANKKKAIAKLPAGFKQLWLTTDESDEGGAESRLALAVATDQVGKHATSVELQLGEQKASIPVTWTVAPAVKNGSRTLVSSTPFKGDSSTLPTVFAAWRKLVERTQLDVDYRLSSKAASAFTPESLSRVDIVLVGEDALANITDIEVARLQGFICGGGRVIVFADAFFAGTTKSANRICKPFGLMMLNREPPIGTEHEATREDLLRHPLSVGVKEIVVGRPSPTEITDPKMATALVTLPTFGPELPFAAIATTKSGGEVITVGNSLWWNRLNLAKGNERLMRNLLVRAPRMR